MAWALIENPKRHDVTGFHPDVRERVTPDGRSSAVSSAAILLPYPWPPVAGATPRSPDAREEATAQHDSRFYLRGGLRGARESSRASGSSNARTSDEQTSGHPRFGKHGCRLAFVFACAIAAKVSPSAADVEGNSQDSHPIGPG